MKTETIRVRLTFTEPLLGSAPGNKELLEEFIASKAPTAEAAAEEVASVEDRIEKAMTVFAKDNKGLFVFDYYVRGYLKKAVSVLIETGDLTDLTKWTYKRAVDTAMIVSPRRIYLKRGDQHITKAEGTLQRPLRCETMQGERVALASSEVINEFATCEFAISVLVIEGKKSKWKEINLDTVRKCLDYGQFEGMGQWRSGSYGRFTWEEISDQVPPKRQKLVQQYDIKQQPMVAIDKLDPKEVDEMVEAGKL